MAGQDYKVGYNESRMTDKGVMSPQGSLNVVGQMISHRYYLICLIVQPTISRLRCKGIEASSFVLEATNVSVQQLGGAKRKCANGVIISNNCQIILLQISLVCFWIDDKLCIKNI